MTVNGKRPGSGVTPLAAAGQSPPPHLGKAAGGGAHWTPATEEEAVLAALEDAAAYRRASRAGCTNCGTVPCLDHLADEVTAAIYDAVYRVRGGE